MKKSLDFWKTRVGVRVIFVLIFLAALIGVDSYNRAYPIITDWHSLERLIESSTLDDEQAEGTSDDMISYFKEKGFVNVRVQPLPDDDLDGGRASERTLAYVMIGDDKLSKLEDYTDNLMNKRMPKNTPITLYYRDFPKESLPLVVRSDYDAEEMSTYAKKIGFTNVTLKLDETEKLHDEWNIQNIIVRDKDLFSLASGSENLFFISKETPIVIHYKEKAKKIERSAIELTGLDDKTVAPFLEQLGFENIKIERVETDTHETGTVKDIVINGTSVHDSFASFWSNDPVIVEVWDRSAFDEKKRQEEEKKRQEEEKKRQEEADRRNPSAYASVSFDAWNHDEVPLNQKIVITGKVLQNSSSLSGRTLRVAINNDYDKVVLVKIPSSEYKSVLAEDDRVTIYGINEGLTTYTTVLGAENTIPGLKAVFYHRD